MYIVLLIGALLPAFLIILFTYKKDRDKEPVKLLVRLFLSGILSCFMVILISSMFISLPIFKLPEDYSFFDLFLHVFIGVALVEEGCKFSMAYINGYKNIEFDELYDIILYCVMVSCGFAAFENIFYIFGNLDNAISVTIMRALLAVPAHAFFALFMGYYLSLAKLASLKGNRDLEKKNIVLSILIPTVLHGTYDFCASVGTDLFVVIFYIFVIGLYIVSIKRLNFVARNNKSLFYKPMVNNFCTRCGAVVSDRFCPRCGSRQN